MNMPFLQISVNLLLIVRCLLALSWGIGWATFIQFNRLGQFLAEQRTWVSVVIGVGADLLIAFGATWIEVVLVVAFSSVGIIGRSFINETRRPTIPQGYKVLWALEDGSDRMGDTIKLLERSLETQDMANVSRALSRAHQAHDIVWAARRGEYEPRNSKRKAEVTK